MAETLREIIHLLETTRARQIRLTTSERTLREMERLPSHLIDDVNARGLPLDHLDHKATTETKSAAPPPYFKNSNGSYKLYSFD